MSTGCTGSFKPSEASGIVMSGIQVNAMTSWDQFLY